MTKKKQGQKAGGRRSLSKRTKEAVKKLAEEARSIQQKQPRRKKLAEEAATNHPILKNGCQKWRPGDERNREAPNPTRAQLLAKALKHAGSGHQAQAGPV